MVPTPVTMLVMPETSSIVCPLLPPLSSPPIEPRSHEVMQSTCPVLLITPPPCMTLSNGFPDAPSALALPKTVHKAPTMHFGGRGIPYTCRPRHYCHPKSIIWDGPAIIDPSLHGHHCLHIHNCHDYCPEKVHFISVLHVPPPCLLLSPAFLLFQVDYCNSPLESFILLYIYFYFHGCYYET